jgi:3-oxoadipate enol-lactonase/3-oxoadipate enol-lactonase/4-carboxymuconolactone decarboxylase
LNAPLAYCETGARNAPPLVLLHALATSRSMWKLQIPIWALRHRVIAFDLPGHGESSPSDEPYSIAELAERVSAACDELDIRGAALVGLSLGSMIGQVMAVRRRDIVSRLVLSHGVAATPPNLVPVWHERADQARACGMRAQVDGTIARWFTDSFRSASPLTMEWIASLIATTSVTGYVHACGAIAELDNSALLSAIACPTLVLAGTEDSAAAPAALEAMAQAIPNARFATLLAAHLANVERPTVYAEKVGEFLAASP